MCMHVIFAASYKVSNVQAIVVTKEAVIKILAFVKGTLSLL